VQKRVTVIVGEKSFPLPFLYLASRIGPFVFSPMRPSLCTAYNSLGGVRFTTRGRGITLDSLGGQRARLFFSYSTSFSVLVSWRDPLFPCFPSIFVSDFPRWRS